ncbi:MAG: hypothetical protein IPG43_00010 [Proteobacteria bacterium]|nr:hypothetical protein [Pseudomonadota bacterium]
MSMTLCRKWRVVSRSLMPSACAPSQGLPNRERVRDFCHQRRVAQMAGRKRFAALEFRDEETGSVGTVAQHPQWPPNLQAARQERFIAQAAQRIGAAAMAILHDPLLATDVLAQQGTEVLAAVELAKHRQFERREYRRQVRAGRTFRRRGR